MHVRDPTQIWGNGNWAALHAVWERRDGYGLPFELASCTLSPEVRVARTIERIARKNDRMSAVARACCRQEM